MQLAGVSNQVVVGKVVDILSIQSKLEALLRKEAAVEYKRKIQRPSLAGKGPDLTAYLHSSLRLFKDDGIERRLKFGQSTIVMSGELLADTLVGVLWKARGVW